MRVLLFIILTGSAHFWASIALATQDQFEASELLNLAIDPKIKTVEDFIAKLPKSMLSTFTLIKNSQSLQLSSPSSPRVLLINKSKNMIVTFNGDPKDRGYEAIEVAAFDPVSSRLKFFEIEFAANRNAETTKSHIALEADDVAISDNRITISKPNPLKCMQCHTATPNKPYTSKSERIARYMWHPYPNWPTSYGSDDDYMFYDDNKEIRQEMASLKKFRESAPRSPRYKNLIFDGSENAPYCNDSQKDYGDTYSKCRVNLMFTTAIGRNQLLQMGHLFVGKFGPISAKNYLNKYLGCSNKGAVEQLVWDGVKLSNFGDIFKEINPISDPAAYLPDVLRYDESDQHTDNAPWNNAKDSIFKLAGSETTAHFEGITLKGNFPEAVIKALMKTDSSLATAYSRLDHVVTESSSENNSKIICEAIRR